MLQLESIKYHKKYSLIHVSQNSAFKQIVYDLILRIRPLGWLCIR